jgi:proteasome lid subunit RPN8/RPN11
MSSHMSEAPNAVVHLPAAVREFMIKHAREGKPEEICGIVRGRGLNALEAIRGRNIAEERIENYDVDPQTLLLQFKFEDEGDEMMGIYHSHPVSVAYPSATDAWNAHYPECIYFICSLEFDESPVIRAFRMTPHFVDVDIDAARNALDFYETRPGLFAYYQPAGQRVPAALKPITQGAALPFYVVYFDSGIPGDAIDARVVSIVEYPVAE